MITRRSLLTSAAVAGAAGLVAACSPAQVQQFETQWATIASEIQQAVAKAANYVPTIESIANTAAAMFGPQYLTIVEATEGAVNAVVTALINVVTNLTPPASARLAARLRGSSPRLPVSIGKVTTINGDVAVNGWKT